MSLATDYRRGIEIYGRELDRYAVVEELYRPHLMRYPDHASVNAVDEHDYDSLIEELSAEPDFAGIAQMEKDLRLVAVACFSSKLVVSGHWNIDKIEVVAPGIFDESPPSVNHMGFVVGSLTLAKSELKKRGIAYDEDADDYHRWLEVPLPDAAWQLHFTNRALQEVIHSRIADGEAVYHES